MKKKVFSIMVLCLFCVFLLIVGYEKPVKKVYVNTEPVNTEPVNVIGLENGSLASEPTIEAPIATVNGVPICEPGEVITGDLNEPDVIDNWDGLKEIQLNN